MNVEETRPPEQNGDEPEPRDEGPDKASPAPPLLPRRTVASDTRDFLKYVFGFFYNHNPFYLISACLVLYGLHTFFHTSDEATSVWVLMEVLSGYTLLMALTAVLVVRLGKVWEDARSILLIVVLLLLAMPMSLDEVMVRQPGIAKPLLLTGLAFAVMLSETVLRGVGIRLSLLYRLSYHGYMALFFLYSIFLKRQQEISTEWDRSPIAWGLLAFPYAVSLLFLMLLPAVRMGAAYVRRNGTPWKWPSFPWVLFGILGVLAAVRTYYLTFTMYPGLEMRTPFEGYFLLPLILTAAVLILEFGLASGRSGLKVLALLMPAAAVALAFPGTPSGRDETEFLEVVLKGVGSPALVACLLAGCFYVYALLRGLKPAVLGVLVTVLTASFVSPSTVDIRTFATPEGRYWLVVAGCLACLALLRRSSWQMALAAVFGVTGASLAFRGTWFTAHCGAAPVHLCLLAGLLIGALYNDAFAKWLRRMSAFAMPLYCLLATMRAADLGLPLSPWTLVAYTAGMTAAALAYGLVLRERAALVSAAFNCGFFLMHLGTTIYRGLEHPDHPQGLKPLFWGAVCFVVAAAISCIKAGLPKKIGKGVERCKRMTRGSAFGPPGMQRGA